jgi:HEPN domain-containing protein
MNASEAQRWMAYAKSDLDAAYLLLEKGEFFPRQICFMSQQAGEKALKAVLVYLGIQFPKIHDLDRLRELIPQGWQVKEKFPQLYDLSVWSVEARYPGHTPDVTEEEARETLQLAEAVFEAVATEFKQRM